MQDQKTDHALYTVLDRIGNLIRAQEWTLGKRHGLQPIQLRMLYYLGICNQYSNTPSGVTDYLQLTKGTVSQSLKVLENKGYIEKQTDPSDKRQVHLLLTESGRALFDQLPPDLLRLVDEKVDEEGDGETGVAVTAEAVSVLQRLLVALQQANGMQGFGVCHTCHYHQALDEQHFRCGLTGERLARPNAALICREHQWPQQE